MSEPGPTLRRRQAKLARSVGESPRSSQQGCRSRRWETSAVNCPFGRLAYPMRGEATTRVLLGRKRHGRPGIQSGRQRWERPGWQQTQRPEHYRMTAAAAAGCLLLVLIKVFVPAEAPVVIGFDDTIERRWGPKINARGIYRDPVRSSKGHFV